jgi:hypothetical protein
VRLRKLGGQVGAPDIVPPCAICCQIRGKVRTFLARRARVPGSNRRPDERSMRGQHIHRCVAVPGRLELPTFGLGNRCSIRLSYGTARGAMYHRTGAEVIRFPSARSGRCGAPRETEKPDAMRRVPPGSGPLSRGPHFPGLMPAPVTILHFAYVVVEHRAEILRCDRGDILIALGHASRERSRCVPRITSNHRKISAPKLAGSRCDTRR